MRSVHNTRAADARGFTLIELMVTLVVMAAVLAGVYGSFFKSQAQSQRMNKVAEARQGARTAVQLIERETRMAGSGWGRTAIQAGNNGTPLTLTAVQPRYGGLGGNDSLTLIGAWQGSTTLSSSMGLPSSALIVANTAEFNTNDLIIVTTKNGLTAHMFQVTGKNAGTSTLFHANTSPYNTGHTGWPAGGYGIGSRCYKVTMSSYFVDSTTYRKPALVRTEFGQPNQLIAYDPAGLRFWYLLQDGTWTREPVDLSLVDKVIPVVLTRVRDPRLPSVVDSVWAMVRPRTY